MSLFRGETVFDANTIAGMVIPTGNTLAGADADSVTIGGVIAPQHIEVSVGPFTSTIPTRFFIANRAYRVTAFKEVHSTASSSGTLQLEKLSGVVAPGSGSSILTGTVSTAGTANTVVSGTIVGTSAADLAAGDSIALVTGGTQTSLAGAVVTVSLKRI